MKHLTLLELQFLKNKLNLKQNQIHKDAVYKTSVLLQVAALQFLIHIRPINSLYIITNLLAYTNNLLITRCT